MDNAPHHRSCTASHLRIVIRPDHMLHGRTLAFALYTTMAFCAAEFDGNTTERELGGCGQSCPPPTSRSAAVTCCWNRAYCPSSYSHKRDLISERRASGPGRGQHLPVRLLHSVGCCRAAQAAGWKRSFRNVRLLSVHRSLTPYRTLLDPIQAMVAVWRI
ncbi:hypothetical protein BAUCODRAFT_383526 [Baudoinia panamericana UAMH 10762]|uniref:Uncharacterized protein n=1 Tax=Baudoinia panamericana (strain UAMH 10762) TaxID=717646 RepID=M2LW52_BAUPA|nr:uncharacterized protein BAUCODRAFT_383526 [Baudoinia panamericana UAMH 10762]EMC98892.1 hypothetical protein BAUCODRAFT_383526 [Baudoinia panamericana UAMH 10762]